VCLERDGEYEKEMCVYLRRERQVRVCVDNGVWVWRER